MALVDCRFEPGSQEATYRKQAAILWCWFPGPVIPDKINHQQTITSGPRTVTLRNSRHQLLTFFLWLAEWLSGPESQQRKRLTVSRPSKVSHWEDCETITGVEAWRVFCKIRCFTGCSGYRMCWLGFLLSSRARRDDLDQWLSYGRDREEYSLEPVSSPEIIVYLPRLAQVWCSEAGGWADRCDRCDSLPLE